MNVVMMMPMSVMCHSCGEFIYKGTKFKMMYVAGSSRGTTLPILFSLPVSPSRHPPELMSPYPTPSA